MDAKSSEKVSGAANQQERLESYIAGFVDGEGCFHVAIQRNDCTRAGWQLVPEFRISQDVSRVKVLDLARQILGCGALRENHRRSNDQTYVLVVRRREDLITKVIPFFERNPLLSCKQQEFVTFSTIVRGMAKADHLTPGGFERFASMAVRMNGGGRYRRLHNSSESRILRDHMPSALTDM
jgi:LAGLIDADG endonuclease